MHLVRQIMQAVEKTHPRLGNLVAMGLVAARARMCMIVVAPAGTGKSSASNLIGRLMGESILMDSVTRSGLAFYKDKLPGYRGVVLIDDMGKIDTAYSRTATLSSFAELCYSHYVEKHTVSTHLSISDYQGGAVLNVQPSVLSQLVTSPEWDAVISDKTLRYYHLYRPVRPQMLPPGGGKIELKAAAPARMWGQGREGWRKVAALLSCQWSDARLQEHMTALLKALAALDGRPGVDASDYSLLAELVRPCSIERYILVRYAFEGERVLSGTLISMLVELASWDPLTVDRVCQDYKVGPRTVMRVLETLGEYFSVEAIRQGEIVILPRTRAILEAAGARRGSK